MVWFKPTIELLCSNFLVLWFVCVLPFWGFLCSASLLHHHHHHHHLILLIIFFFFLFFFLFFLLLSSFFPFLSFTFFICFVDVETKEAGYKKGRQGKEKKEKQNNNSSNNTQQQQQHTANNNKTKTTTKQATTKHATTATPTNTKTPTKKKQQRPNKNETHQKKGHQIATKLLTAQKSGRKLRTSQNAIKLQKQAFQKIKTQNFAKCIQKAIFIHTNIFKLVHLQDPWHNVTSKNPIFIRATPCLTGSRWTSPCKNSGLRFYKTELLPHGVCNLWLFGLSRGHHTVPLKCLFL